MSQLEDLLCGVLSSKYSYPAMQNLNAELFVVSVIQAILPEGFSRRMRSGKDTRAAS
jgi:hypothetical protein